MKNFFGMPPSTSARLGGLLCFTALLLAAGAVHRPASAAIVMTAQEIGGDVVFSYQGTLDIAGLTQGFSSTLRDSRVRASGALVQFTSGSTFNNTQPYNSAFSSKPSNLGTTSTVLINADTSSATAVFGTASNFLYLESSLTASDWLTTTQSGSMTFQGTTLAGLGIVPGTYTWVLNNSAADTITLNAVPEPSSLMLVGAGGVVCVFVSSRRRLMGKR
jgi:hypothetical protein